MGGLTYTKSFEGSRLVAYQDQLGNWTIGVGHKLGPGNDWAGTIWTQAQVDQAYADDYAKAQAGAQADAGGVCWSNLNDQRQCAITDMAFNIGVTGLKGFHNMLAALLSQDWSQAASLLLQSKYAQQLPRRAKSNASIIESGDWPNA
jgi:lysozyme